MQAAIQISAQYGDPKSANVIRPLHKSLNELFEKTLTKKYFRSIDKLTIVFRVSGTIWNFPGEGPDQIKFFKQQREVSIDLVIPEAKWCDINSNDLRVYIQIQLRRCFNSLLDRIRGENELVNEIQLVADFEGAMMEFGNL
jgi:hypothetical protein